MTHENEGGTFIPSIRRVMGNLSYSSTASALVLALILIPGCGLFAPDVPPDVILASEGQAQVIEMQGANTKALILAYDADLRAAYRAHARERRDALIASGQYDTPEKIKALFDSYEANNARWEAELNAKRDEFLGTCASNVQTGKTLSEATRRYLDFLSESRARLQEILDTLKPPPAGPVIQPAPATQPTLNTGA